MPEVVKLIARYRSLEDLEAELVKNNFEKIARSDMDPTIRRVCEGIRRGDAYRFALGDMRLTPPPTRFELVQELLKQRAGGFEPQTLFGTWDHKERDGVFRAYVGVHFDVLQIVIVNRDFVERRRSRYSRHPLAPDGPNRRKRVRQLIFEVLEQWSGPDESTLGATYARIYMHVADYCNIEVEESMELVDLELQRIDFAGSVEKSEGDCWRIPPKLIRKRKLLVGKGVLN